MNGFQQACTDLVDRSLAKVEEFKEKKNYEKRATGVRHSLGATIGSLGAVDVHFRLEACLGRAFRFGLTRVGNPTFPSFVDGSSGVELRWVINRRDLLPLDPPHAFGYRHP